MELCVAEQAAHDQRRRDAGAGIIPLRDTSVYFSKRQVLQAVKDREQTTAQVSTVTGFWIKLFRHFVFFLSLVKTILTRENGFYDRQARGIKLIFVELLSAQSRGQNAFGQNAALQGGVKK